MKTKPRENWYQCYLAKKSVYEVLEKCDTDLAEECQQAGCLKCGRETDFAIFLNGERVFRHDIRGQTFTKEIPPPNGQTAVATYTIAEKPGPGSKAGLIRFELALVAHEVRVRIADTGSGIPTAERDRVFERFYRGEASHSRRLPGVGLGLSLTREIVRAHGGEVLLEEGDSNLTVFRVTLPTDPHQFSSRPTRI